MTTQQIGERRDTQQHAGEQHVVALGGPAEQRSVGRLVDGEAERRDDEEAAQRHADARPVAAERQTMVAGEGHHERHAPADDVGRQRTPLPLRDEQHDDGPVHQRGGTANGDEAHDTTRTLCICVDDVGMHAGIDAAALRLAAMGRVHALGGLVGGASWGSACEGLRRAGMDGVDIGLHLDLTETPLLAPSRRSLASWIAAGLLRWVDGRAVRAEIRAQLDRFEATLGHAPAFVDGHRHVHQLPGICDQLLAELQARYGSTLPWLRCTRAAAATPWHTDIKPRVIERLGGRRLARLARQHGFVQNHGLLGVYDFEGGPDSYRTRLAGWLRDAHDADLLMCHPSLPVRGADPLIDARVAEFQVLAGPAFPTLLRDAAVCLAPMSRILAGSI